MSDPRYLKRKVRPGKIDVDYDLVALIVHYEVEATVLGDDGEKLETETKSHQKTIKLKINRNTDIKSLAEEVVAKAKLIHHSKLQRVENLIYELQQHTISTDNSTSRRDTERDREYDRNYSSEDRRYDELRNEGKRQQQLAQQQQGPRASLDDLDDYMEMLYGSLEEKVKGTGMIVELARDAQNLEVLSSNESLMGALARVLKEDYKHSIDLTTNIMYIWFSFSNFTQLHGVLTSRRIGKDSMKVIDLNIKRSMLRQSELQTKTNIAQIQGRGQSVPEKLWEELRGEKKSTRDKDNAGGKEDNSGNARHPRIDIENERAIMKRFLKKQDKLLFVCFHILLNLAEDVSIEYKMVKLKIARFLTAGLSRTSAELLILAVTFLKKLSIFELSKDKMMETDIVARLVRFIPCNNERLMKLTLRLLWNLSFDATLRQQMIKARLIPELVKLLVKVEFRAIGIKLLYHMSMDEQGNSEFTFTQAIPLIMQLIVSWPKRTLAPELGALAVNVSHNSRNCESLCQDGGLKQLIKRAYNKKDPVIMKVVRNISQWTYNKSTPEDDEKDSMDNDDNKERRGDTGGAGGKEDDRGGGGKNNEDDDRRRGGGRRDRNGRGRDGSSGRDKREKSVWCPFVDKLFGMMVVVANEDDDMFVEVLGVLGNLTRFDLPERTSFSDLIDKHDLIEFLSNQLIPGSQQDDVILQIIILIGVFATEREAARIMVGSPLIRKVYQVMRTKKDDSAIVLQTMYSFGHILNHPDTWDMLIFETHVVKDMCDCLLSKNIELRSYCDKLLAHVMELCTPQPKKRKKGKKKKKRSGDRRRGEGKRGHDDDSETSSSEEDTDTDEADSEEEGKSNYSPSRSMDEMDEAEQQRVEIFNMIRRNRFKAHNREWLEWQSAQRGDAQKTEEDRYGGRGGGGGGGDRYGGGEGGGGGGSYDHYGDGQYENSMDQQDYRDGMEDMDDSGQWGAGNGGHENIAVDMALLGGGDDDYEGKASYGY